MMNTHKHMLKPSLLCGFVTRKQWHHHKRRFSSTLTHSIQQKRGCDCWTNIPPYWAAAAATAAAPLLLTCHCSTVARGDAGGGVEWGCFAYKKLQPEMHKTGKEPEKKVCARKVLQRKSCWSCTLCLFVLLLWDKWCKRCLFIGFVFFYAWTQGHHRLPLYWTWLNSVP